jgi:hypothetical protein
MDIKVEKLHFTHFDEQYKKHRTEYSYELEFSETGLNNVRNELGFKVEPNSYAWEYFSAKYK